MNVRPLLLLLAPLMACTTDSDDAGTARDTGERVDEDSTAPTVVATSPEDGARGVLTSTLVTFEFDEPMDPATTLDALTASVAIDDAFLDATGQLLTIRLPLEYDAPGGAATTYRVEVREDATDLAGLPLEEPAVVEFSTAFQHELVIEPDFNNRDLGDGSSGGTWMGAGDTADDEELQGQATFLLEDMPAFADIHLLQEARFDSEIFSVRGNPGLDFGEVHIDRIPPDGGWVEGYSAPTLGRHDQPLLPDQAAYAKGEPVIVDLTPMLEASLRDGDWRMRFRVEIEGAASADQEQDAVFLSTRNSTLFIHYLTL